MYKQRREATERYDVHCPIDEKVAYIATARRSMHGFPLL